MDNIYTGSRVIELKASDLVVKRGELHLKTSKNMDGLIIFYAPWCLHCKATQEKFMEYAEMFSNKFMITAFNTYNKKNVKMADKLGIREYPTYMVFDKNGLIDLYMGKTDVESILDHIIRYSQKEI